MAVSLKTRGLQELNLLRRRVLRQFSLQGTAGRKTRISREDRDWLIARLDEIEAYIVKMEEHSPEIEGF